MRGFTPIDSVVRSSLMSHGLTIHYYVTFLHYALQGLRELEFDTIGKISSTKLTVDSNLECQLPPDFIDWIRVGWERNRHIIHLGTNSTWIRTANTDSSGNQIPYSNSSTTLVNSGMYDPFASYSISQYGEDYGRLYGLGNGSRSDIFQIVRERNVMLVGGLFSSGDSIYIDYLSSSNYADSDAFIHPYSEAAIEAYIRWKYAEQRTARLADVDRSRREFYNQYRLLRARMNDISKEDMLRLSRDGIKQSIKS